MIKTLIALILTFLNGFLGSFGLCVPSPKNAEPKDCYPIVFVHGLGGWGEDASFNDSIPHWGMLAGSIKDCLNSEGYEAYAASVGPVSSAWDRACELYAHITGTRVDYGAAHSATHGHERFGQTYADALVPDWDNSERKINLIGHSFGGVTARLLAQLCSEGDADEIATGGELSALFTGELKGRIASVTTLAAPHNGSSSTLPEIKSGGTFSLEMSLNMIAAAGEIVPTINDFYPFRLEHFGLSSKDICNKPWETLKKFNNGSDRAELDLSIDGAHALNQKINCQPDIYYFSYASQMTRKDIWGNQVPKAAMWFLFKDISKSMGQKRAAITTSSGVVVDSSWRANDGLVSVVSAQYPFGEPNKSCDPENIEQGVWQVMPLINNYDHVDFVGGMQRVGGATGIKSLYLNLAKMLEQI